MIILPLSANGLLRNTCPGLPICAASARPIWTALPPNATTALDRPSADPRPSDTLTGPPGGVALTLRRPLFLLWVSGQRPSQKWAARNPLASVAMCAGSVMRNECARHATHP